VDNL